MPKSTTVKPKKSHLETPDEEERQSYNHLKTEEPMVRRATVFESLLGGFGSQVLTKKDSVPMIGDPSSKYNHKLMITYQNSYS